MRFVAGAAILLSVLCLASGAFAHAALVSTEPADDSILAQAPKTVRLRFNESVTPAVIRLTDAAGRARGDTATEVAGEIITITMPEGLPQGTQIISYRVVSGDGHPVAGSMAFSIGAASGMVAGRTVTRPVGVAGLIWLTRIATYVGLFAGVGGAFFFAWIARTQPALKAIIAAFAIGVLGAVASLGLQGLDVQDLGLGGLLTPRPWNAALATSLAPSLFIAIAAMLAGMVGLWLAAGRVSRAVAGLALAGVGLSLAASGHAATALPQELTRPAVFLHGIGAAFWIGALIPLLAMASRPTPQLLPALYRFSRLAVPVVGILLLTGFVLAIIQLGSFRALIETRYGAILLIKIGLVAALLGLAALNRFRLTPALVSAPFDTRSLVRSILSECAIALALLAVVAGWRFAPPPRVLAAAAHQTLALRFHSEKAMGQVLISPGHAGTDNLAVQLLSTDGSPLGASETLFGLSLPERGIESLERQATFGQDGSWHLRDAPLPYPGRWHMRIEALVTDFEKVTLEGDFDLPAH